MEPLKIQTLGEFSIRAGNNRISNNDNRTKKIWLLLSYLITHRGRTVSQRKMIELLWGDDPASNNPENALRITFHRARTLLNQLWPTAGRDLILHKDNGYLWNPEIPVILDHEEFDRLANLSTDNPAEKLQACLDALSLYRGDFLDKQSSETWVIPISTHFHNLYIRTVLAAASLLSGQSQHAEAVSILKQAAPAEPYHEPLYQMLMTELAAMGDPNEAAAVYDGLSKRLFDDFGIRPSEETRAVYRAAVHSPRDTALPMDQVLEQLQEAGAATGAMQCDYDYFKVLCYAESRAMERNGNATHVVLMSISRSGTEELTKSRIHRIMGQLGEQIRTNLRRGDTFSRCSVTQYIIMLPKANYENSCMVCRRIEGAFHRAHPRVNVKLQCMVQPLTPTICVP